MLRCVQRDESALCVFDAVILCGNQVLPRFRGKGHRRMVRPLPLNIDKTALPSQPMKRSPAVNHRLLLRASMAAMSPKCESESSITFLTFVSFIEIYNPSSMIAAKCEQLQAAQENLTILGRSIINLALYRRSVQYKTRTRLPHSSDKKATP